MIYVFKKGKYCAFFFNMGILFNMKSPTKKIKFKTKKASNYNKNAQ
jgi:hypothetical protein